MKNTVRIYGTLEKPAARCTFSGAAEACDARRTPVRLRFSVESAAARDGFSSCP
jgi:hypothetical protein